MEIIKSHIDIGTESRPGKELTQVRAVVIHWTGAPKQTAQTVISWWDDDKNGVYGSAHFVIDMAGKIYEAIPPNEVAYHVGSRNYTDFAKKYFGEYKGVPICSDRQSPNNFTIGVEMIPVDSTGNFTESTYQSAIKLVKVLLFKHDLELQNLLMHSHIRPVNEKRCPKIFVDDPAKWEEFKMDMFKA